MTLRGRAAGVNRFCSREITRVFRGAFRLTNVFDVAHDAVIDRVAFVVAETVTQARDAAELIEIDYEPLPAVVNLEDSAKDGAVKAARDELAASAAHDERELLVLKALSGASWNGCRSPAGAATNQFVSRAIVPVP